MPRGVRPQPDSSREISALTLLPPATRPLVLKKKRAGEAARPETAAAAAAAAAADQRAQALQRSAGLAISL
jgi:hypothetical protein